MLLNPCIKNLPFSPLKVNGFLVPYILIFFVGFSGWGQQGVVFNSTSSPGPTQDNPIPVEIRFEDGVDELGNDDFILENGTIQNIQRLNPGFEYNESFDFPGFPVKASLLEILFAGDLDAFLTEKIKNAVISIDLNSNDEIIYLTYGNGVFKYNATGPDERLINATEFSSPLDMVVDNFDRILVADTDEYQIRVYNEFGNWIYDIGGAMGKDGNEFYGPSGLAISHDNILYVADSFTGTDPTGLDQIKLYEITSSNGIFIRRYGDTDLIDPYRIAVDSDKNVYVSDSGGNSNTGRVVIFKNNDDLHKIIANSANNSPGSLMLDKFGYLYVVNYLGDLNFTDIYQNPVGLVEDYDTISSSEYPIDVYSPFPDVSIVTTIDQNLNLPVDIALNSCGYIYINNLDLGGSASLAGVDASFDFNVEIFERHDNFSINIIPEAPGEVIVSIEDQALFKCDPQPEGEFSIIYKEEDENLRPVALPDSYSVWENNVLEITAEDGVLKNDSDPEDDELIAILDLTTPDGDLDLREDGSFTYTPNEDFDGTDSFTYRANDGQINSNEPKVVEIRVKKVPVVTCIPSFNLELDTTGEAFLNIEDLYTVKAGNSDFELNFDLSKENFSCPDIGENSVTLSYTYSIPGEGSESGSCIIAISVEDNFSPVFETCLGVQEEVLTNGEFILPDYRNQLTGSVRDNCLVEGITLVQDPAPQTSITVDTEVHIIAYDSSGNESVSCSFEVRVAQPPKPKIVCPDDSDVPELILDATCEYEDFDFESLVTFQNYSDEDFIQTVTRVNKILTVKNELSENGVLLDECTFFVNLLDRSAPSIDCPSATQFLTKNIDGKYIIPDYGSLITDNCDANPMVTQVPEPGTEVNADTSITLSAKDDSDNASTVCTFNLELQETPPVNQAPLARDDFYSIEQDGVLNVIATEGVLVNDEDDSDVELQVELVTDVANGILDLNADGSFTYTPDPGFEGIVEFTYMASDGELDSNIATARIDVFPPPSNFRPLAVHDSYTTPYETILVVDVPGILGNDIDDDETDVLTAGVLTGVTKGILTLNSDGSFTYLPHPLATGEDSFTYVANDGTAYSNVATVTIEIGGLDENPPVTFDDNFSVFIDETLQVSAPGILANDSFETLTSISLVEDSVENGTLTLNNDGSFIFVPTPGFTGNGSFRYVVLDGNLESNIATATIIVNPRPIQNEAPIAKDDFYEIQQGEILIVDAPGILGNDTDANGDVLTSRVGSVSGSGFFEFSNDGSFKYTPQPDFVGTERFTYEAKDGEFSSNTATVIITVIGSSSGGFLCKGELTLQLDETGDAILQATDLYTGDPGDRQFTLSKSSFDCSDLGENSVVLNSVGSDGSQNCTVKVTIVDNLPPDIQTQSISVSLDSFGSASITPEMVDNGTKDNCGVAELSLNILNFSCENLGINPVILTAKDSSGNTTTQTVNVTVTGDCEQPPIAPFEYIFIYPNPTTGPFTFDAPTGWIIEKVDVFDYRGRYILTAEYPMGPPYGMDLSDLQTAVYTLHLTTNQGKKIIRVIIR